MLRKIVSGGQTGADRAGLKWAMKQSLEHGGYCPKGRKAEDGRIPDCYQLAELTTASYPKRTEANVIHSDGTLIVTASQLLEGGSARTAKFCRAHKRPYLHIWCGIEDAPGRLRRFIQANSIQTLNVAGTRASRCSTIDDTVFAALDGLVFECETAERTPARRVPKADVQELFFLAAEIERLGQRFCSKIDSISQHLGTRGVALPIQSQSLWQNFSEKQFELIEQATA